MARPFSIKLFAAMFAFACAVSLLLAVAAARSTGFGFAMTPQAAERLIGRIFAIRLFGLGFALTLLVFVFFARSRGARGALVLRWVLGIVTSVAFLRGIGVVQPGGAAGTAAVALSVIQIVVEGAAIMLLFGEDAADWFERPRAFPASRPDNRLV